MAISTDDQEIFGQEASKFGPLILHYLWDPIGVSGIPMARDEYQSYVPQVVKLLNESADAEQIASYLNEVVTKRMGLSENADAALQIVAVLLDWKAVLTAA